MALLTVLTFPTAKFFNNFLATVRAAQVKDLFVVED
jgi:hypothetical protein